MDKLKELEKAVAELDFIYQDGAIFYSSDVKTLEILTEQLTGIVKDLKINSFGQVRE